VRAIFDGPAHFIHDTSRIYGRGRMRNNASVMVIRERGCLPPGFIHATQA
jgi:hypothetical protein